MKLPTFFQLFKDNLFVLLCTLAFFVISYFLNVLLARHLSPSDYGDLAVILRLLIFFVPFVLFGTEMTSRRYLPRYLKKGTWPRFKGYLFWSHKIFLRALFIIMTIGFLVVVLALQLDYFGIRNFDEYHPLVFSFWLIPLYAYLFLQSSILQALKKYTRSVIYVGVLFPLLFIALVMALVGWIDQLNVYHVLFSNGLAALFVVGIQTISIKRMLPKSIWHSPMESEQNRWFKASLTMLPVSVVSVGLGAIDIVMLEMLGHSNQDVGEFAVISTISGLMTLVNAAMNVVLSPSFSAYHNEAPALQMLLNKGNLLQFCLSIIIFLIIIFGGPFLLKHFGTYYNDPSIYIYLIVRTSVLFIASTLLAFAPSVLFYSKHVVKMVYLSYLQLAIIVILELILIPSYGIWGAIIGSAVGMLGFRLCAAIMVRRLIGVKASLLL
ncbi:oligosaccharide flippase family protein [Coxiella burnetii]|uniref:Hypothetical membrane associated protein n=1 Tax=Coxiella burnetii (strain Dugway 5J108-111) TaxID=434922 RepID=A9KDW4_COXBN|nr:oligosaccharide flippase family protein [Coxiella burnetii]ABS77578.1 hypothetical membrane associated protein [Coxiella burnetii Dugway 5J108-111]